MSQRHRALFLHIAHGRDAPPTDDENRQGKPRRGRHDQRQRHHGVGVKDADAGKTRTWACELASPSELAKRGFTRESLKVGMSVRVVGTRAKDGSFKVHTEMLSADNSVLIPR